MLRSLVEASHKVYTCSCLVRTGYPEAQKYLSGVGACRLQRWFQTSPASETLEKSERHKRPVLRAAQALKEESLQPDQPVDLQGLTDAGITIPTLETHAMLIGGIRYDELPIAHIKASLNNTIIKITDYSGMKHICKASCGTEGFKNVKKSTNVAAQATGLSIGNKILKKGVVHLRVLVKGLGAGRLASIKGLEMAGIKVVSITDNSPIQCNGPRPRKRKRL